MSGALKVITWHRAEALPAQTLTSSGVNKCQELILFHLSDHDSPPTSTFMCKLETIHPSVHAFFHLQTLPFQS